jgi:hypothetical protein
VTFEPLPRFDFHGGNRKDRRMAFNNVGFATIAPGGSFRWGVLRNGGQDFGAQYVGGDPKTPGSILTDAQTKFRADDGHFEYWATFHNLDNNRAVSFSMQGGGFS